MGVPSPNGPGEGAAPGCIDCPARMDPKPVRAGPVQRPAGTAAGDPSAVTSGPALEKGEGR